jgi:hypothetical protein
MQLPDLDILYEDNHLLAVNKDRPRASGQDRPALSPGHRSLPRPPGGPGEASLGRPGAAAKETSENFRRFACSSESLR